jgi:hypothetical protein
MDSSFLVLARNRTTRRNTRLRSGPIACVGYVFDGDIVPRSPRHVGFWKAALEGVLAGKVFTEASTWFENRQAGCYWSSGSRSVIYCCQFVRGDTSG